MRLLPLFISTLAGLAIAHPTQHEARTTPPPPPQTVHLVFHAGPVEYNLTLPADGKSYRTNNGLNVNLIDATDFNINKCEFKTHQPVTFVSQTTNGPYGWRITQLAVGPPQPIDAVICRGTCLGVYSTCFENGSPVGDCCNGYCAANKCRPFPNF